jgi:DNA-binding PadR family transcriptional regulator
MHILLALADRRMHGYAIMQAVEGQSGGTVRPGTGSLYAALQRLLDDGLIAIAEEDAGSSRRGNSYEITEPGSRAVLEEAERMRQVLTLVTERDLVTDTDGRGAR